MVNRKICTCSLIAKLRFPIQGTADEYIYDYCVNPLNASVALI